ncbi:cytidyltransferase, partial [Variovorax sp. Varisp36]
GGGTITLGFLFVLALNLWTGVSEVRAVDDAAVVRWVPIAEFLDMQERIYVDHFFIANHFLGGLGMY